MDFGANYSASAAEVKAALARLLKVSEAEMPAYWDGVCAQAAAFGSGEAAARLLRRGFDEQTAHSWDRRFEFTLDLSLWKAIMLGGAYSSFAPETVRALDRREELGEALVFVGGVWVRPALGDAAQAMTGGPRSADAEGVFNWQPDEDPVNYGIEF